ncbi:hypothetical protein IAT38_007307 [Cryptococcus sp. DSM 104549]
MTTHPSAQQTTISSLLEEGIIDLRAGTDYSKCPDVYHYLQIVAEDIGETGDAMYLAEKGREHLQKRMKEGTGLFVPCKTYETDSSPRGTSIRYDETVAAQQPPFMANTWAELLATHLVHLGDAARVRLEELHKDRPRIIISTRAQQHDRVVKGLGWAVKYVTFNRVSTDNDSIVTNIRSPLPKFLGSPPPLGSPRYKELIESIYLNNFHHVCKALIMSGEDADGVTAAVNDMLAGNGFAIETLPRPEGRYDSPWAWWDEEAEERHVKATDMDRFIAWENDKEAYAIGRRAGEDVPLVYTESQLRELSVKKGRGWCPHDEPYGYCRICD